MSTDDLDTLLGIDRTDPVQDLACRLVEADTHLLRALVTMRRTKAIPEADVALRMGTTVYAVHVLERDDSDPKLSTLRRYALAIGALVEHHVSPASPPAGSDAPDPARTPDRQWAVRHPSVTLVPHGSPHSVLYTASKIPGGVIVTRLDTETEWAVETDCLCGRGKPIGSHYAACPAEVPAPTGTEKT